MSQGCFTFWNWTSADGNPVCAQSIPHLKIPNPRTTTSTSHSHPQTTYKQSKLPPHQPISQSLALTPIHTSGTQLYHTTPPTKSTHHFTFYYPHNLTFITPKFNIQTKLNSPQSSLTLLTTLPSIKNSLNFHLISPNPQTQNFPLKSLKFLDSFSTISSLNSLQKHQN